MISPFKAALGSGYKDFEARLEAAIHVRYGLPPKTPQTIKTLIKKADKACAYFEATQLAGFSEKESLGFFGAPPPGYSLTIEPLPASLARRAIWSGIRCWPRPWAFCRRRRLAHGIEL